MIKIKSLKISNIGRFVGDHFVDIESLDSLFQIDGKNLNTGGSSGSGKSTVINSLDYFFGVNDLPSTVLQSRLTKDPMAVQAVLEKNNELYTVTRSKSGGLSIIAPTGEVSGSSKISEEYLDKLIGIPKSLLRPVFHKRQNEGGFFLNKTPKEIYAFLASCLELESFTKKQEKAELEVKEISPKIVILTEKIKSSESTLITLKETKSSLVEPKKEVDGEILRRQETMAEKAADDLTALVNKRDNELLALVQPIKTPYPTMPVEISEIDLRISKEKSNKSLLLGGKKIKSSELNQSILEIQNLLYKAQSESSHIEKYTEELNLIKQEINKVKSAKCPTCDQDWSDGHSHPNYQKMMDRAKSLFAKKQAAIQLQSAIPQYEATLVDLKNSLKIIDAAILEISSSGSEIALMKERDELIKKHNTSKSTIDILNAESLALFHSSKENITSEYSSKIEQASGQYNLYSQIVTKTQNLIDLYNKSKEDYLKNTSSIDSQIKKVTEELLASKETLLSLDKKLKIAEYSAKLIKSYVNQLFFDSLAQIAEKATSTLMQIPNMETVCLTFEVFKETKSGAVKEEVSATISMDNEESVPVKSLSGGERASIDLAVDLAVIDMIEQRTGKGINIFILDEPFNGLDSENKNKYLQVLQSHDTTKKIGIVDHSEVLKEMISSRLTVTRNGQESSINEK